jgi:hypothetical protein
MTRTTTTGRPCPVPPHPQDPENDDELPQPQQEAESALSRFARWVAHAPAERAPLPAIPAAWAAAEVLHLAAVPAMYPAMGTLAAAGLAYGIASRGQDGEAERLSPAEVAGITAAAGGWLALGDAAGPLAGGFPPWLTMGYLAVSACGYCWLRTHSATRAARARRDAEAERLAAELAAKTGWHRLAPLLGLAGSHLLSAEDTLLGETWLIDTRGTGKLASQVNVRTLAERLGEIEMIPEGRIDVQRDRLPGRLRITIRRTDPWARALEHPAAHPGAGLPYAEHLEEPSSVRKPLVIGIDPETGEPLRLTLWDEEEGGKVVMIVAKKGSGKTVLLNNISERVTACPDAQLLQVNLGKNREDRRWAPLAAGNALGRDEIGRGRRLLEWLVLAIEERSKGGDDSKVTPTPATPLLVVKIDEVDQVARDPVCKQHLSDIASKCRSEGVSLIIAGQRATAAWIGGADLRANVDIVMLGRFSRPGEAKKATGEEISLPDMGEYGEGRPGVWLVYELGGGGGYERGRVFKLSEPADIEAIVERRAATRRPYVPEPALASLNDLWDLVTGDGLVDDEDEDGAYGPPAAGTAGGLMPGTADIAAKTAAARAALDVGSSLMPAGGASEPASAALAADVAAERTRQMLIENYGDIDIPPAARAVLMRLLADPAGTNAEYAAGHIGKTKSTAHRYLSALRAVGVARLDDSGKKARYRLASSPVPAGPARPGMVAVPDDEDDQDDDPAEDRAAGDGQ